MIKKKIGNFFFIDVLVWLLILQTVQQTNSTKHLRTSFEIDGQNITSYAVRHAFHTRNRQFPLPAEMFTLEISNLTSVLSTHHEISSSHVPFNVTSLKLTDFTSRWLVVFGNATVNH
jgi:hypothetical protein